MEQLLDALEQVLLRVRCGQTLNQALSGLPEIPAPAEVCGSWVKLRDSIFDGNLSAEASLLSYIQHLRLNEKITALIKQKTLGPRTQAYVITALAWVFWLASLTLFPGSLRPGMNLSLVMAALLIAGALWIRRLLRRAEASLWFADWLIFLSRLAGLLSWGQTLGPAFASSLGAARRDRWPQPLLTASDQFLEACRRYEPLPTDALSLASTSVTEVGKAFDQLRWMDHLRETGQPLASTLESFAKHSLDTLERKLSSGAETLSMKLLLPLFLCYLPAFLLALFGPILKSIATR